MDILGYNYVGVQRQGYRSTPVPLAYQFEIDDSFLLEYVYVYCGYTGFATLGVPALSLMEQTQKV